MVSLVGKFSQRRDLFVAIVTHEALERKLAAKNGDIKGTVIGSYDDFSIHVDSKKGNSNLNNKDGGEKTLSISCNNGDINIELI